jgi:hypothetical protein
MHFGTKKLAAILIGSLFAATACADGTNITGQRVAPGAPAYDGSGWAGSGNRTDSTTTTTSDGSGWAGSGNLTATDSAATGRGSGWAGSGN